VGEWCPGGGVQFGKVDLVEVWALHPVRCLDAQPGGR
jgi:hypothetical protein